MLNSDPPATAQRSGSRGFTFLRWVFRVMATGLLALVAAIVLFRFVPVPSTPMLARMLLLRPVERDWVPLTAISPHLVRAVIAAEDQRFCSHAGIDWVELNKVLEDEDGPGRGASTLTMQTVKNVFLWPGRSVIRKGLELPLALVVDAVWGKTRVIEIYLNVAEWGEGIYGAEAAARTYFNKPASALGPAEAARLAAALPNPRARNPARPTRNVAAAARGIQQSMAGIAELTACVPAGS